MSSNGKVEGDSVNGNKRRDFLGLHKLVLIRYPQDSPKMNFQDLMEMIQRAGVPL